MSSQESTAAGEVELRGAAPEGTGGLVQQAVDKAGHLVAAEIQLAKQELTESLKAAVTGLVAGLVAALSVVAFVVMVIVTVVTAISLHWAAALGFAVVFLVLAAVGAMVAVRQVKRISPLRQTVQTLKEDVEWAKQQLTPGTR